jgi:hypothetical protein
MVNISKNLNVESKGHLYKLINTNDELSSNKIFTIFMDRMYILYNGCDCNFSMYDSDSDREYTRISTDEEVISKLKEFFKCDGIIFN